eukprot:TRINITY_DN4526_c0_g1_i1.p1 TRINITY_DN4526_c0_g1~~TRINITY_DN4526_c0_g1_i1.p1  ORF type:complete len:252 (-),score=30.23 TRINITY_DN4526_c0_g1_i1:26-781(-)
MTNDTIPETFLTSRLCTLTHGLLMLFGFCFFLNLGGLQSRYRFVSARHKIKVHLTLQIVGTLLSLASFVLIYLHRWAEGHSFWEHWFNGLHQIFGFFTILILPLQGCGGFVAWKKRKFKGLRIVHEVFGKLLIALGILVSFLGINMLSRKHVSSSSLAWFFYSGLVLVIFVVWSYFELKMKYRAKKSLGPESESVMTAINADDPIELENIQSVAPVKPKKSSFSLDVWIFGGLLFAFTVGSSVGLFLSFAP